jgi:hypothetical protein
MLMGMRMRVIAAGMLVIVAMPGTVGMHMIMLMMGVFAIDFYFTGTAAARRTHRSLSPSTLTFMQ